MEKKVSASSIFAQRKERKVSLLGRRAMRLGKLHRTLWFGFPIPRGEAE
jgi:hypothetical protein